MAHRITFDTSYSRMQTLLSKDEVRDIIDMFYRFGDSNFFVTCDASKKKRGLRGSHSYNGLTRTHTIFLSRDEIQKGVDEKMRMGGNTNAPSYKMGAVMVLVHELQHANQAIIHGSGSSMHRRVPFQTYLSRPCERDARAYVDSNLDQIAAFCQVEVDHKLRAKVVDLDDEKIEDELEDLADALEDTIEIHVRDLNEELRLSGMNNSKNIQALIQMLKERGVQVIT